MYDEEFALFDVDADVIVVVVVVIVDEASVAVVVADLATTSFILSSCWPAIGCISSDFSLENSIDAVATLAADSGAAFFAVIHEEDAEGNDVDHVVEVVVAVVDFVVTHTRFCESSTDSSSVVIGEAPTRDSVAGIEDEERKSSIVARAAVDENGESTGPHGSVTVAESPAKSGVDLIKSLPDADSGSSRLAPLNTSRAEGADAKSSSSTLAGVITSSYNAS